MTEADALPILYSFRRCPYAMRARMALAYAGMRVELREILLQDKPGQMLALSPKGTVPVLQLDDGQVIDESLDVMHWALEQHDPDQWRASQPSLSEDLIASNDGDFKTALDRYKYFTRFPEHPRAHYRQQGEVFLQRLEDQLSQHDGVGLTRISTSLADIAIFPFVRQFANSDAGWFAAAPYPLLRAWLDRHASSDLFKRIMKKQPLWTPEAAPLIEDWKFDLKRLA